MTDKEIIRKKVLEVKENCFDVKDRLPSDKLLDAQIKVADYLLSFIDSMQEEPVSEDKMTISKEWFEHCKKSWYNEGYIDGEYNRDRQFEKERLKHCDALTEEQAQMESDFVVDFIKKNKRTPTFIDAIEYGIKLKLKEENKL